MGPVQCSGVKLDFLLYEFFLMTQTATAMIESAEGIFKCDCIFYKKWLESSIEPFAKKSIFKLSNKINLSNISLCGVSKA